MARREPEEEEPGTFTWPLLGALYGSLMIVGVIAILESRIGRHLEDEIDAPARTLIAAWLIPAWLIIGALVLGAIDFALNHET
jgi:hypothetical protein